MKKHISNALKMTFFAVAYFIVGIIDQAIVTPIANIIAQYKKLDKIKSLNEKLQSEKGRIKRGAIRVWHYGSIARKLLYAAFRGVISYLKNFFRSLKIISEDNAKKIGEKFEEIYGSTRKTSRRGFNFLREDSFTQPTANFSYTTPRDDINVNAVNASTAASLSHSASSPEINASSGTNQTPQAHPIKTSKDQSIISNHAM